MTLKNFSDVLLREPVDIRDCGLLRSARMPDRPNPHANCWIARELPLYDPRTGSNPRLLCLINVHFGQQ
jgi:hypothetical protein